MNAQEAIIEVYEAIGEPRSDLPIYAAGGVFDFAAAGSVRILAALNRSARYVSTYHVRGKPPKYFREMETSATFEPVVVSETLLAQASPYKTIALPATMSASAAGRFNGWIYDDGVAVRRVLRHTVAGGIGYIVLDVALDATPETRTLSLRQVDFTLGSDIDNIATTRSPIEVLRVFDVETKSELVRSEATDSVAALTPAVGTPSTYFKRKRGFVFDVAVSDSRSYEAIFYAYPEEVVAANDELPLPEAFHDAIVLFTTVWGFARYAETTQAYSAKKNFESMMATLLDEVDVEDMLGSDALRPIVK